MNEIEVVEIDHDIEHLDCPFCKKKVMDMTEDGEAIINSCIHLLFIATDAGFEYWSDQFLNHMGLTKIEYNFTPEMGNFDEYTNKVSIPGSIKYAAYTPSPGCLGIYYGFAP